MANSQNKIKLTNLIDALRTDLIEYNKNKPAGQKPLFKINGAILECTVEAKEGEGFDGGVGFSVIKLGAKSSRQNTATCKISLNLEALETSAGLHEVLVAGTKRTKKKVRKNR